MASEQPKTVVTEREETRDSLISVVALPSWQIALVRTARVYLQSLLGFLTAGATGFAGAVGVQMPVGDFGQLFMTSLGLAIAPAVFTLLQNGIELLARLDTKAPELRG